MTDNIEVTLTTPEIMKGALVGVMRAVQDLKRGASHYGADPTRFWDYNIDGALGEMVVAKHLGLYWDGAVGDYDAPDVGPYQVRTNASRRLDDLPLKPNRDKPGDIFILTLGFMPRFVICGWIYGADGMQTQWLRDGEGGSQAFFVPRSALMPMSELPLPPAKKEPGTGPG